jgi:GAF domain-containing protein
MLKLFKSSSIQTIRDESEKLASIRLLRPILIIEIVGLLGVGISDAVATQQLQTFYVSLPLLILLIASVWWLRRGILYPAQILIPVGLLLIRDYLTVEGVGIHDVSLLAFAAVIILAYLTLTKSLAIGMTALTILSTSLITLAGMNGMIHNDPFSQFTNLEDMVEVAILLAGTSAVMYFMIDRLNQSIRQGWENEQKQIEANQKLKEERATLEIRVKERTQALERRAIQLRAASEVGNAATGAQNLNDLLTEGVRLISARLGFYHVGIFLKDESGKYAILQAANSEGGQRMLKRGHRLEIGEVGIVGYVVQSGKARIALDVGKDATYFDNPDLHQTHSEMALPLNAGNRILGALDIQSIEPQAFKQDDIEVLQVVADQLAIAIENSRLLAESQAAVEAVRRAYGEISTNAWKRLLENNSPAFKSDDRGGISATKSEKWNAEELQALREGSPVRAKNGKTLHVPILQRGQAIGIIRLAKHDPASWSEQEVQLAQSLTAQLSDSLEAARLYGEATHRAERERAIAEVTNKIGSGYEIDDILRSMTEELGKMFEDSEVVVQITREENDHA